MKPGEIRRDRRHLPAAGTRRVSAQHLREAARMPQTLRRGGSRALPQLCCAPRNVQTHKRPFSPAHLFKVGNQAISRMGIRVRWFHAYSFPSAITRLMQQSWMASSYKEMPMVLGPIPLLNHRSTSKGQTPQIDLTSNPPNPKRALLLSMNRATGQFSFLWASTQLSTSGAGDLPTVASLKHVSNGAHSRTRHTSGSISTCT